MRNRWLFLVAGVLLAGLSVGCAAVTESSRREVIVVPRGPSSDAAFRELHSRGGPTVLRLGRGYWRNLIVPSDMRFRAVDGRKLVEAVAALHKLEVVWIRDGEVGIIQSGATEAEVELVLAGLKSGHVSRRREAAWRAGWVEDARVLEALAGTAGDPDAEVVHRATRSAERFGWTVFVAVAGEKAWTFLETVYGESGQDKYRSATLRLRKERQQKPTVTDKIDYEKTLARLERELADEVPDVRVKAAWALGGLGGEKAVMALKRALADEGLRVREAAVDALGCIGGEKAVMALKRALADENTWVREAAADALGCIGGEKALALLTKALEDKSRGVRLSATEALGRIGPPAVLALSGALANESDVVRESAAQQLGGIGPAARRAVPALIETLNDSFVCAQVYSGEALRAIGPAAVPELIDALQHKDSNIRSPAAWVLGRMNPAAESAVLGLIKALKDKDADVRWAAVYALGEITPARKDVTEALIKVLRDQDVRVRKSAAEALGKIGPATKEAIPALTEAQKDDSEKVRQAATEALGKILRERDE